MLGFYKFRASSSCKEFITPKSVVSRRADQLLNAIGNDNCIGFSDLDIFIIFIQIILKYRFYVSPRQLLRVFHFFIIYLSIYLITFQYLKPKIHFGAVTSC